MGRLRKSRDLRRALFDFEEKGPPFFGEERTGSIGVMVSALGFSNFTAYCYLIASMGLQALWSFGLACLDIYALRIKRDLRNPVLVSLFVVGDWVFPYAL
ncbi:UNVERIFIED_CONTAM: CASP-like protein 5B3 [Sesamum angustifolium]|uniref:CASP-like protein n=1 Tax=Sesamum angustifolium TaxID=2727405 RepID=A0AAW2N761_9LAMI